MSANCTLRNATYKIRVSSVFDGLQEGTAFMCTHALCSVVNDNTTVYAFRMFDAMFIT